MLWLVAPVAPTYAHPQLIFSHGNRLDRGDGGVVRRLGIGHLVEFKLCLWRDAREFRIPVAVLEIAHDGQVRFRGVGMLRKPLPSLSKRSDGMTFGVAGLPGVQGVFAQQVG